MRWLENCFLASRSYDTEISRAVNEALSQEVVIRPYDGVPLDPAHAGTPKRGLVDHANAVTVRPSSCAGGSGGNGGTERPEGTACYLEIHKRPGEFWAAKVLPTIYIW